MSIVAPLLDGAEVLDLFAGSGALGIEALSRGAAHVTFVENAPGVLQVIRANLAALGAEPERFRIVRGDALHFARALERGAYTLAFADPPYGSEAAVDLGSIFRGRPFASLLGIEHARALAIEPGPDLVERRYGDTVLSFLTSPDEPT
jgi:16S rRNA (guanine966-N2)-methyltransferase